MNNNLLLSKKDPCFLGAAEVLVPAGRRKEREKRPAGDHKSLLCVCRKPLNQDNFTLIFPTRDSVINSTCKHRFDMNLLQAR